MTEKAIPLGPWSGVDTFHEDDHAVFQLGDMSTGRISGLVSGNNINLDDGGFPSVREGLTSLLSLTAAHTISATPWTNTILIHDGSIVSSYNLNTTTQTSLVAGLDPAKSGVFCRQAGKIFHTNGSVHSVITGATAATNWGMTVPPVATLGTIAGNLPAGRYRVTCCFVDAAGVLSGAPKAKAIIVDGTTDITVTLSSVDSNAAFVRIYASHTNEPDLFFVKQVAIGALPTTISDTSVSNELLEKQYLVGPQAIPNIVGIGKWRGYMLLWRDFRVMHSHGNWHHLFNVQTAPWKLPYEVVAAGGSGGVCWIATKKGMFTYTGEPPFGVLSDPLDDRAYAAGSLLLADSKLPYLKTGKDPVMVFASEDGEIIGTSDGTLIAPHNQKTKWDVVDKKASITYREINGISQLLINLE